MSILSLHSASAIRGTLPRFGMPLFTCQRRLACNGSKIETKCSSKAAVALPLTSTRFWMSSPVWKRARINTLRCLIGCTVGDFSAMWYLQSFHGELGLSTIMALSMASGITSSLVLETTLLRLGRDRLPWLAAARTAAGMSMISMITMEAAENLVDYHLTGGMVQFDSPAFWGAAVVSIAAGFLAPLPYNYIRLRNIGDERFSDRLSVSNGLAVPGSLAFLSYPPHAVTTRHARSSSESDCLLGQPTHRVLLGDKMTQCANLNCEPRNIVKATTDIAGSGVLFAYIISAILAILAIVYGYLSDSLPESYLNETDRTVIDSFQACLPSERNIARLRVVFEKIKSFVLFGRKPKPHRKLTRRQREEVVKRFILTLSDQQLATGLAILIAAIANQCTLTVWEFQLAFALAWFSSTTHLATLDCLREYFLEHGAVRNWRVGGMIALLLLLSYSLIMSMASVNDSIPLQCTFYFFGDRGLYQTVPLDIFDILSAALTLVLLTWQYLVRIQWSYKANDGKATSFERMMFKLRTKRYQSLFRPSKEEVEYIIEEAVSERISYRRRRSLEQIRNSRGMRRHWLIAYRASETYSQSFLSLGPMLTFMIAFGFTQLYLGRWQSGTPLEIDTTMGIGQITPLFLLVLPALVAAESYYEVQDLGEVAHSGEPAREPANAAATRHERQKRTSTSGAFPLPGDFRRAYDSVELRDLELLDASHSAEDYEALLPALKRFFHLETKLVEKKLVTLRSKSSEVRNEKSLLGLKAHIVSSYHLLNAQEAALKVTTLTSLVEYTVCSVVSAALGILVYIEGSGRWTTIASIVLFGLCLVYKFFDYAAYIPEAWFDVSEADYKRLMTETRNRTEHLVGTA
ncbi:hypothetical protein OPT61_g3338 [Boeremia exigua]|uniref:Uncharacterized protein n=1 Tax=Boeremia exigua TaxID=749465 RepID=A0ACC2IIB9_9PLEO|nr:hypothetical protein OPT61_g3338 [Boeremia exigua]